MKGITRDIIVRVRLAGSRLAEPVPLMFTPPLVMLRAACSFVICRERNSARRFHPKWARAW
jgi:hypothetical protein